MNTDRWRRDSRGKASNREDLGKNSEVEFGVQVLFVITADCLALTAI